jgi:succinate dehydrogenase subunit D
MSHVDSATGGRGGNGKAPTDSRKGPVPRRSDFRARNHPAYWAFVVHRASGVLLALFLPLHFWTLGLALQGEAKLEGFLRWSDQPLVKVAETILVLLLAAHMTGGLRLLALEFLAWRSWQKSLLAVAAGVTLLAGLAFLLNL